ncbi:uncharacterized protein LOC119574926 [Penaeus monodon]|uniref:uncharacterized protein LOC119574926 n=1 Tax=Penaeus monodon TaxID=6687 RepID=UPI0018A6EF0E|nr:uncharacterized protein LOC119574926 [Penaeus monodon]
MAIEGWRPRRSLVFCGWGAEEYGVVRSLVWTEQLRKQLADRAVASLTVDMAIEGWRPRRSLVFCGWGAEEYGVVRSLVWTEQLRKQLADRALASLTVDMAIEGWRPRRSLVFCGWGAEEYGVVRSLVWTEQLRKQLADRALASLTVDMAIEETHVLTVRLSRLLEKLRVYLPPRLIPTNTSKITLDHDMVLELKIGPANCLYSRRDNRANTTLCAIILYQPPIPNENRRFVCLLSHVTPSRQESCGRIRKQNGTGHNSERQNECCDN